MTAPLGPFAQQGGNTGFFDELREEAVKQNIGGAARPSNTDFGASSPPRPGATLIPTNVTTPAGAAMWARAIGIRMEVDPNFSPPNVPQREGFGRLVRDKVLGVRRPLAPGQIRFAENLPALAPFDPDALDPEARARYDALPAQDKMLLEFQQPYLLGDLPAETQAALLSEPDPQPLMQVAEGNVVFDPNTREPVFTAPRDSKKLEPQFMVKGGTDDEPAEFAFVNKNAPGAEEELRALTDAGFRPAKNISTQITAILNPKETGEKRAKVRESTSRVLAAFRSLIGAPPRSVGTPGRIAEGAGVLGNIAFGQETGNFLASIVAGGETSAEELRERRTIIDSNLIPAVEAFIQRNTGRLSDKDTRIAKDIIGSGGLNDPSTVRASLLTLLRITLTGDALEADEFGFEPAFPVGTPAEINDSTDRLIRLLGGDPEKPDPQLEAFALATLREMKLALIETRPGIFD